MIFVRCIILFMLAANSAFTQKINRPDNLLFYQLTKEQGLSANAVNTVCTDKNNNLWVGTTEGLNRFNGKTVTHFLKQDYPQFGNDHIQGLVCDAQNRIWVRCENGSALLIDERRHFHKIKLQNSKQQMEVRKIIITKAYGAVLFTKNGFFYLTLKKVLQKNDSLTLGDFSFINIPGMDTLATGPFVQLEKIDENRYILTRQQDMHILNFNKNKIDARYALVNKWALLLWKPGELLMYDRKTKILESLALSSQIITIPFNDIKDQFGKTIGPRVHAVVQFNNGNLLMATYRDGIYILDIKQKKLMQYLHRPGDVASPPTNRPAFIHVTSDEWVFFGSRYNGVSFFKNGAVVGQQKYFADNKGNSYDAYINSILQKNNDEYYIGTSTNLLRWNRTTNNTVFVNYATIDGKPVLNEEGATILAYDKLGRLWFLTSTKGLVVLDKNERLLKRFEMDTVHKNGLMSVWAEFIIQGMDGWVWIGTQNGLRRIHPNSFIVDDLSKTPFHKLQGATCMEIYFDDPGYIWVATSGKGLWKYDINADTIQQLTTKQGLISNRIYCIEKDKDGNLYIGSDKGMQIFFKDGSRKIIAMEHGLINSKVNILMRDKKNRIWMGNVNGIGCYNPADFTVKYFDQQYGLSVEEVRLWAYYPSSDGELFWGTEGGIQYFYPDELYNHHSVLKAAVTGIETVELKEDITQSRYLRLSKGDNNITFLFSTSGFLPMLWRFYQYKLDGQDKDWIQVVNQNAVRYNSLPPGEYVFKLRASADNKNWVAAENEITIFIPPPFYQTRWFRILAVLCSIGSIFYYMKRREKSIKRKETEKTMMEKLKADNYRYQLEIEQVVNYFATSISIQNSIDELLWDVSKNLIGKLGFEDCMIYLWNDDKTVLIQKAGYGSKGAMQIEKDKSKYNVIRAKGIVGAAAESKQSIMVQDTSKDSRYFTADDKIRLSELCVPIMYNNEVLGVINTEHTEKYFYTERHLQILNAIAAHCADTIIRIRAEQETRNKELEVLKLNKDLAESQLTALRSQMNPHFIFNALNSVQQYILQGNIKEANRYLSKFSRLQREVLYNSDQDFIPLEKELEVLHLYLELEQLRFEDNFTYTIQTDENLDDDEIKIPPMIIQPFVENSIWHGLMPKKGERWVHITFKMKTEDLLECTVKDNGIGREAAARLKKNKEEKHNSKGLSLVYDRLDILRQQYKQSFEVSIEDKEDENGLPAGTEVRLLIYTG